MLLLSLAVLAATEAGAQGRRGPRRPPGASGRFDAAGPQVGDTAPDLELTDVDESPVRLSELWRQHPLILVLGSYTCPAFREHVGELDGLVERLGGVVSGAVLYTVEAHPSGSPSPYADEEWVPAVNLRQGFTLAQPVDLAGRREAARLAVKKLWIDVPVLVDGMDNVGWQKYGPAPNTAFLIDPDGLVVERQSWFDPPAMEEAARALEELLRSAPRRGPEPPPNGGR